MRTVRFLVAVACSIILPAVATAGPMPSAAVRVETWVASPTDGGAGVVTISPTLPPQASDLPGGPVTSYAVRLTPRMPTIDASESDPGREYSLVATTAFWLQFDVTDQSSGQAGLVQVDGVAVSEWLHHADGRYGPKGAYIDYDSYVRHDLNLTLGSNRYSVVIAPGQGRDGVDPLVSTVTLSVAPADPTPEPGTLALAALGLLPVAAVARRRRRA